nr:6537_t:CDS:2 [Entrophospora candida]
MKGLQNCISDTFNGPCNNVAAHFTDSLWCEIVNGEKGIIESAERKMLNLSSECLGEIYPFGELSPYEKVLLSAAIPELKETTDEGVNVFSADLE